MQVMVPYLLPPINSSYNNSAAAIVAHVVGVAVAAICNITQLPLRDLLFDVIPVRRVDSRRMYASSCFSSTTFIRNPERMIDFIDSKAGCVRHKKADDDEQQDYVMMAFTHPVSTYKSEAKE